MRGETACCDRGNRHGGGFGNSLFEGAILEKRDAGQSKDHQDDRACGCEQGSFQEAGAGTGATGFECRFVGEQNLRKQVRQKDPLRNFACAATPGLGSGRLLELRGERKDARGSGVDRGCGLLLRGADFEHIFNDVGAHAGEEKAAQEWIDADLAGTGNFRKERYDAVAHLAQIAREFIGAGQVLELAAAPINAEACSV